MSHIVKVAHIYHRITGLPEDDVVNTLTFSKAVGDWSASEASDLAGYVQSCFFDASGPAGPELETFLSAEISRVALPTTKVYSIEGGSPIAVEEQPGVRAAGAAQGIPPECAVCLSFHANLTNVLEEAPDDADLDTAPERPAARRRGRIFFGPLNVQALSGTPVVPHVELREALGDLATRLFDVGTALGNPANYRWAVWSKQSAIAFPVTGAWIDTEFDTQRRRGRVASSRDVITLP